MVKLLSHFLGNGVPAGELLAIVEASRFKKYMKGDYFVKEGNTSKSLAFITTGLFQYFYLLPYSFVHSASCFLVHEYFKNQLTTTHSHQVTGKLID